MKTFQLFGSLLAAIFLLTQPAAAQSGNFFAGRRAGASNASGTNNTFVGAEAGRFNTFGSNNSFVGESAGTSNTTGQENAFFGARAGTSNISGNKNVFVGAFTGFLNTTGSDNAFFGQSAGANNTTGNNNTFIGSLAGFSNKIGIQNAFLGRSAGQGNTSGSNNAFFGHSAGKSNTNGSRNTFVGSSAGEKNTNGIDNTFVGFLAGSQNTSGGKNIFLGCSTGQNNTTGNSNTFVGNLAGLRNTSGIENTFVGNIAGFDNITGNGNTYLGFEAGNAANLPNLTNAAAIGRRALVSRSNALVLGSIAGKNGAISDVNVGIGVDAPIFQLHLSKNSAAKPGSSSWTVASDERLKKNVAAFTDGLNVLLQVNPVKYYYNGKAQLPIGKEYVGVIAQKMKEVAPYMVGEFLYQDSTGNEEKYLDYDASALTYILVNSVKEQQKTILAMQDENQQLKQELTQIKQLLSGRPGYAAEGSGLLARLWQNAPNPFDHTTVIKYFVPQSVGTAAIILFNNNGQQVSNYPLHYGEGEITLSTGKLAVGTYVYTLVVDGTRIENKKLIVAR